MQLGAQLEMLLTCSTRRWQIAAAWAAAVEEGMLGSSWEMPAGWAAAVEGLLPSSSGMLAVLPPAGQICEVG